MQSLALQLTTTFVDDAIELVRGFGNTVVHLTTGPSERIAKACDVAGVLEQRRHAAQSRRGARKTPRRGACWPFGPLSELT